MKSSTEIIAYYNKRKQALEEKADNPFTMFLEGYGEGFNDGKLYAIDKACEWLRENVDKYLYNRGGFEECIPTCGDALFNDFRKAMKQ